MVIDETQKAPALFDAIKLNVDRKYFRMLSCFHWYCVPARASAQDLAASLLAIYGSLRRLLLADRHAAGVHGLTSSNYVILQAGFL